MGVVMKEAEWLESEVGITISLQMKGASLAKLDLIQTDTYIKVRLALPRSTSYRQTLTSRLGQPRNT